jgi:multisubunit Na+/H+ antiporter MnhG subunit
MIAVVVQMIFDTAFYILFKNTPLGMNHMLDFFKRYAKETKLDAIFGDSILVLVAVLLSAYLKQKSIDFNIVTLIIGVYLIPYIIYMKD